MGSLKKYINIQIYIYERRDYKDYIHNTIADNDMHYLLFTLTACSGAMHLVRILRSISSRVAKAACLNKSVSNS